MHALPRLLPLKKRRPSATPTLMPIPGLRMLVLVLVVQS